MAMEWCKEIVLFGTRIVVDSMRKTASLNNLMDYQHAADAGKANLDVKGDGYVSDNCGRGGAIRERKRGTPWSEEEHKQFLMGLKKVGKGDWKGISKKFVNTRTPTQVASHAQKYFLRHTTFRSRRRSSLFDITTETVAEKPTEDLHGSAGGDSILTQAQYPTTNSSNTHLHPMVPALPPTQISQGLIAPVAFAYPLESSIPSQVNEQPMTILQHPPALQFFPSPNPNSMFNRTSLSLDLGLSLPLPSQSQASPHPAFQTLPCLMSTDSYISVA